MPMAEIISTLPDALLCHILSFLPTKIAVTTSILSKRWKPLWLSVPTIHFDEDVVVGDQHSHLRFAHFVDSVIQSRDERQPIKTFRFRCWSHLIGPSNVNRWVNTAIQRKLEHLKLYFPFGLKLPRAILSCRTLVVLKLRNLIVNDVCSVDLPSLKIMHLKGIDFRQYRHLMELLSGCPILEEIKLKYLPLLYHPSMEEFKCFPKVVRANIRIKDIPLEAIYSVEFLRLDLIDGHYGVRYEGIPMFHNLTHMELIFEYYTNYHWVVEMLKHCPKLQVLVIDKSDTHETFDENWTCPQFIPECLQFHLKTCSLKDYDGLEGEFLFAKYIMKTARVLRAMTICCSAFSLRSDKSRLEMLKKLSLCTRTSSKCELIFK